jgi:hypothetical protein
MNSTRSQRHRNRDGIILFPGVDPKRDLDLKTFLSQPIDSRDPFDCPDSPTMRPLPGLRTLIPADEVTSEWAERLKRVRTRTRLAKRRPVSVGLPDIAVRESAKDAMARHPLKAIWPERPRTAETPMVIGGKLPKLRPVPPEFHLAKRVVQSR